jgi:hypothetical protein
MLCPSCGHENLAGRKFRVQCGARRAVACLSQPLHLKHFVEKILRGLSVVKSSGGRSYEAYCECLSVDRW